MNGYKFMADSYRKMQETFNDGADFSKKIRILDFLATCDKEDFNILVDSSAFNDIIKAYIKMACVDAGLDDDLIYQIMSQRIFEVNAEHALKNAGYLDD